MTISTPAITTVPHLYKYSNPDHLEWLENIILKHEIYCPKPSQLNDPADGMPKLAPLSRDQMVAYLLKEFILHNPGLNHDAQDREAGRIRRVVETYGPEFSLRKIHETLCAILDDRCIYSLSKRYDNMSLWAKYADNHRGYCLEFSREGLFASAYEVIYGKTVVMDVTDPEQINALFYFRKSQDWSNEEEVRILLPLGIGPTIRINPHILTRLILGRDMSEAHRTTIRKWARQRGPELVVVSAEYDELNQVLTLKP